MNNENAPNDFASAGAEQCAREQHAAYLREIDDVVRHRALIESLEARRIELLATQTALWERNTVAQERTAEALAAIVGHLANISDHLASTRP